MAEVEGMPTADFLWQHKGIVPFLKIDKGLAEHLQLVHFALQLGFAGTIVAIVVVFDGMLDRLDSGFACHGRHCIAPRTPQACRCPAPDLAMIAGYATF